MVESLGCESLFVCVALSAKEAAIGVDEVNDISMANFPKSSSVRHDANSDCSGQQVGTIQVICASCVLMSIHVRACRHAYHVASSKLLPLLKSHSMSSA